MGCVMSAAIAVLLCKHKCSVERLTSSMSFHPPQPPSYTLETQSDGTLKLLFTHRDLANVLETLGDRAGVRVDVRLLRTSRRQSIPLFHFQPAGATLTLLWSHANAMDCGEMYFFFLELSSRLNVNVAGVRLLGVRRCDGRAHRIERLRRRPRRPRLPLQRGRGPRASAHPVRPVDRFGADAVPGDQVQGGGHDPAHAHPLRPPLPHPTLHWPLLARRPLLAPMRLRAVRPVPKLSADPESVGAGAPHSRHGRPDGGLADA